MIDQAMDGWDWSGLRRHRLAPVPARGVRILLSLLLLYDTSFSLSSLGKMRSLSGARSILENGCILFSGVVSPPGFMSSRCEKPIRPSPLAGQCR